MFSQFEIRNSFLDFFSKKDHKIYPSSSLVPPVSTGLLFVNAGMNSFKDVFCGLEKYPDPPRIANSQKCMRISGKHNDLEEVGIDTYHHTFFEMLGNWSFGDYGKEESILFAWELLTQIWKISPERLFVTYYHDDEETATIWRKKVGLSERKVLPFGKKDNFWEMGPVGPCGPCTEIHIWNGVGNLNLDIACDPKRGVNSGSVEFIEIWNLVFIQNLRNQDGSISKLPNLHIDTGMGFERIVSILQEKSSNYDTDLFTPILSKLSQISGHPYGGSYQIPMRVIADHIRAICFSISDGITPSNEGRGYVIRRIIRRALRYGKQLDLKETFLHLLVPTVVEMMSNVYPRLSQEQQSIQNWIYQEETLFSTTLSRGLEYFSKLSKQCKSSKQTIFSGKDAFTLYDTYGFPVDLTGVLCKEEGLQVNEDEFQKCMQEQKLQSASGVKKKISSTENMPDVPKTVFLGEEQEIIVAKLLWVDTDIVKSSIVEKKINVVFDQTVLYAEGGGQVSDVGVAIGNCECAIKTEFLIQDVQKQEGVFFHQGICKTVCLQHFSTGNQFSLKYDLERRRALVRNHTATHLLHQSLRDVLGSQVKQSGSLVDVDRLRFDFTFSRNPSEEELLRVEQIVNQQIEKNSSVTVVQTTLEEAKKMGALAFFEDRYGKQVRVVNMGNYSIELCGGTHAHFLSEVGAFVIDGVRSIASGVKRIQAKTGPQVYQELQLLKKERAEFAKDLSTSEQNLKTDFQNTIFDYKSNKDTLDLVYQSFLASYRLVPFIQQSPWQNSPESLQHFFVSFFPSQKSLQDAVVKLGQMEVKEAFSNWIKRPLAPRILVVGSQLEDAQLESQSLDKQVAIYICWNISVSQKRFDFLFINKQLGSVVENFWLTIDPVAIAKRVAGKFKASCKNSHSLFRITDIKYDPKKDFSSQILVEFWKSIEQSLGSILYYHNHKN